MERANKQRFRVVLFIVLIIGAIYGYSNYFRPVEGNKLVDKNSVSYVNDLYYSDERIYREHLNDKEKEFYRDYLEKIKKNTRNIYLEPDNKYCNSENQCINFVLKIHNAIIFDHPEIIDLSSLIISTNQDKTKITLGYTFSLKIFKYLGTKKIERIIDGIKLETKNLTDIEKIKYVYNLIGENNEYDHLFTYSANNQSYYNVFLKNKGVCSAFAKASQLIFQNIGIKSYIVTGSVDGVRHMWNIVELDGKNYFFDSTAATSEKNNQKLGLTQKEFNSYTLYYPNFFPKIEQEESLLK
ncbi:MAG: hypothetical protein GX864_01460 [Mollicutes bacterium]|nr:hypothetical protein [Mollicutes bacterium]